MKFVSNGRVLNDTFIEGLKRYPGRVRFNISMHSLDSAGYDRIVHPLSGHAPGTRDDLARVQHNLAQLNAAEIPFKLNFVLLNGLNTSIADMAHRFGDHSPIIIRDHYLTRQETAYYYAIARDDIPRFVAHIEHAYGLELQRHRRLREIYFSDGSDAFERFEYVRKLAINTYDHQATEITQPHRVDPAGSGCIETAFGEDSPAIADIADYPRELAQQGFHRVLQVAWELDYYGSGGQPTGDLSLSLGQVPGGEMALVRSCRPLQDAPCPLRPLTQPVPAWLMTHHKLVVPTEPAD